MAEATGLPCPECGADDWSIVELGFRERFREWWAGGGLRTSRQESRRCNRCGFEEQLGGVSYISHRMGWWSIPWRLLRVILDRRSMIPAPYMYVGALLGGLIVGISLDALVDWPWWLLALGFPAAIWLFFLASATRSPGGGRELGIEIRDIVNPRGSWKRHRRHEEEIFRSCPFRFYGLDASWTGRRMLGGHGDDGRRLTSVELTHGDMSTPGPWVRVESAPATDDGRHGLRNAALELWHSVERPPADLPPHLIGAWMHRRFEESFSRETSWTKVPILLDGSPIDFDWLEEGADWVARAIVGDLVVKVRGHDLPIGSIRLATVHNVEPYIEGSRRFHEEQRRLHEKWDE